eukprot:6189503-Pleurochrysis_carterae.AAC.1
MSRRFGFVLEEIYGLESRVVVDEHKQVLISRVMRSYKRPGDVCMDKAASIGRLVQGGVVGVTGGIGRSAGGATVETAVSECRRRIGGNGRQRP